MGDYNMPKKSKKRDLFGMTDEDWDYFEYLMNMQYEIKTKGRIIFNFKEPFLVNNNLKEILISVYFLFLTNLNR